MHKHIKTALILAALTIGSSACAEPTGTAAEATPAKPIFAQDSMNVFRRFDPEIRAKMIDFYQKVLGLAPLQPINLGGGVQMILFKVGSGQIKLASGLKGDRKYHLGEPGEATGIRLYTLFVPDEAAIAARFKANGYDAPKFKDIGNGAHAALVKDPGGFTLELVAIPNAAADAYAKLEVGINVSDLEKSRAFYRDFCGLEELPPVKDAFLGVTKYPYRHGETTIDLWSVGKSLPADTGSAGIQYVISNIDAVNANAKAKGVTVETPLGGIPGFNVRTVWLNDPDGVTNYFYQLSKPTAPAQ